MRGYIGTIVVDVDHLPSDTGKGCIEGRDHRLDVHGLAVCRHDDDQAGSRDESAAIASGEAQFERRREGVRTWKQHRHAGFNSTGPTRSLPRLRCMSIEAASSARV